MHFHTTRVELTLVMRGQLKHTWLENQILRVNSDLIIARWKKGTWKETLESTFPRRIQQVFEMVDGFIDGFSPAQLVDNLFALSHLPDELRYKVKLAVHEVYLTTTNITSLQTPIRSSALALQEELTLLKKLWEMPHTLDVETSIRHCWNNMHVKSKELHELLEGLPNGVVLP